MTAQQLKNSILQLAIEGKLVGQNISDEPVDVSTYEGEVPFDVPENWRWARLGDVCTKLTDGSHNPPPKMISGYPVISAKNLKNGIVSLETVDRFTDQKGFDKENSRTQIKYGDIILGIIGGSIGNVALYLHGEKVIAQRSIAIISTTMDTIYTKLVIESPLFQMLFHEKSSGTAQNGIYLGELSKMLIPLPPLAEQRRIVAKIEELLPSITEYAAAESRLRELNDSFQATLKKSIIQAAIQGKLVENDVSEPPVDVPVFEGEAPFDVPENWRWARLINVSERIHYGYTASAAKSGNVKLLRITDIQDNKVNWLSVPFCQVTEREAQVYTLHNRDILIARTGGTIGKSYIIRGLNEPSVFASYLIRVIPIFGVDEEYIKYFMESSLYWTQLKESTMGTGQPNVNGKALSALLLPLPPLAEQHRIVAKVEELLLVVEDKE